MLFTDFGMKLANFKITENSIIVDPVKGLTNIILRNFILGTVFATLLEKEDYLYSMRVQLI